MSVSPCIFFSKDQFCYVFKLMDDSSANASSDEFQQSHAYFNMISVAGIHFVYISCC